MLEFQYLIAYVKDIEASIKFYNGLLGMPIYARKPVFENGECCMFGDRDIPQLEVVYKGDGSEENLSYAGFTVGVQVDSLAETLAYLAQHGIEPEREPFLPLPGVMITYIRDPDGIQVELFERLKA